MIGLLVMPLNSLISKALFAPDSLGIGTSIPQAKSFWHMLIKHNKIEQQSYNSIDNGVTVHVG